MRVAARLPNNDVQQLEKMVLTRLPSALRAWQAYGPTSRRARELNDCPEAQSRFVSCLRQLPRVSSFRSVGAKAFVVLGLTCCSRAGDSPPWWYKAEPIDPVLMCGPNPPTPITGDSKK